MAVTKLREIIAYVAAKPSRLSPFQELRVHFKGDLTGLRVALDRNLLELRGSCYALTPYGLDFYNAVGGSPEVKSKVCYQCQRDLPADKFWKNAANVDGLYAYCITCGTRKKREAMERYQEARARLEAAVPDLIKAARQWDEACRLLRDSWERIMEADVIIRACAHILKSDNDAGRMHARTTFPRAAFVLNMALSEAKYPQTAPFLREVNFPERLADYIGKDPHGDYMKLEPSKVEGIRHGTPEEGSGERSQAGHPEQDDQGTEGDDPRGAGARRGRGLPAAKGKGQKPRRVPQTRRAVLA